MRLSVAGLQNFYFARALRLVLGFNTVYWVGNVKSYAAHDGLRLFSEER